MTQQEKYKVWQSKEEAQHKHVAKQSPPQASFVTHNSDTFINCFNDFSCSLFICTYIDSFFYNVTYS